MSAQWSLFRGVNKLGQGVATGCTYMKATPGGDVSEYPDTFFYLTLSSLIIIISRQDIILSVYSIGDKKYGVPTTLWPRQRKTSIVRGAGTT